MMTTKLEAAARQELRTLEAERILLAEVNRSCKGMEDSITALREALDQDIDCPCGSECIKCSPRVLLAEQAEQWPVVWLAQDDTFWLEKGSDTDIPLYAAPVRTKDLTDDEIADKVSQYGLSDYVFQAIDMCRAVIAADREKNK